ncbi:MAG TPA: hypothetical protein VFQ30_05880, partial [Ktedonobacteraceae bacterium]|nr:hypothetical protein [Ktedonobacteraceae bacterium]
MPAPNEPMITNWWAEGDTPVHTDSRVAYYVEGRLFMLALCRHLLRARQYIYLANWGMTPGTKLVRGPDHIAGPDGSPEQAALIAKLQAEGLQEQDIAFWLTHELTVQAVLGYAVSRGVEVKVLLWDAVELFAHLAPQEVCGQLKQAGVTCIVDDSSRDILRHPTESLHQKMSIVDGLDAFVGGIDPLIESTGDFDRWDSQAHIFANPLRRSPAGVISHPWHDVHSHISG